MTRLTRSQQENAGCESCGVGWVDHGDTSISHAYVDPRHYGVIEVDRMTGNERECFDLSEPDWSGGVYTLKRAQMDVEYRSRSITNRYGYRIIDRHSGKEVAT